MNPHDMLYELGCNDDPADVYECSDCGSQTDGRYHAPDQLAGLPEDAANQARRLLLLSVHGHLSPLPRLGARSAAPISWRNRSDCARSSRSPGTPAPWC